MRNRRALWGDLPANMMISITIKPSDRTKPKDAICYLALRVRKNSYTTNRCYKEFGGMNQDNYKQRIQQGVEWLEAQGNLVPKFTPPTWKEVLRRLNIRQETEMVKHFHFYDQRTYIP